MSNGALCNRECHFLLAKIPTLTKGGQIFILVVHPVKSAQKFSLNKRLSYGRSIFELHLFC